VAQLTRLERDDATSLLRAFALDLMELSPLEAGSVNSNFLLRATQGTFFARIYEEQDEQGALAEMRLIRELASLAVPTPAPLVASAASEPLLIHGKPFAVYPWVEGEILCQRRVTSAHLRQLGAALARLHLATPRLSRVPQGRFEPANLAQRLQAIKGAAGLTAELAQAAEHIERALLRYGSARVAALPRGIIHGDLFRDNVLWKDDQLLAFIDFESASEGVFAYDVMVCVHAWCFSDQFEIDKVNALLEGYQAVRGLNTAELRALASEGALAALRFATTRISDFALRAPPGTPPKRDYRRFLARLQQLEAGVLAPLGAAPLC
jgi:homoserine kinase type II